jgi:hypothetical protein
MDSTGAVGLDESQPDQPPPPLPGPRSPRPLFYAGSQLETEEDSPLSPLEAATEDAGAGSSTADPWTDPESESLDSSEPDSWTGSPAGEKPAQLSKRQLRDTAEAAVHIGTGMVHTVAAKTELQRQVELYKADAEDAKAIGHPLADIAYRRGDVVGGKLSPDANSLLQSVLGIAGYFAKQINKIGTIRQIEAAQAGGEVQTFPTAGAA